MVPSPPEGSLPPRKRQRGGRRASKRRKTEAGCVPRLVHEMLLDPVEQMLEKTRSLNVQQLLSRHCPARHALMVLKTFEKKARKLPELPHIHGLRCLCARGAAESAAAAPRPRVFRCAGGPPEIHFLQNFPTLSCATSAPQVTRFLLAAVEALVPRELLGQDLRHALRVLVKLRRREQLTVHEVMQGLSLKRFKDAMIQRFLRRHSGRDEAPRLGALKDNRLMAQVLGRLCHFIVSSVAVPLLRAHFYATEAEPGGMQTVYYRKHIWHFLRSRADCGFFHLCLSQEEAKRSSELRSKKGRPPKVRWVPKKRGLRPIVSMAQWQDKGQMHRAALPVLNQLRSSHPELLGASILAQQDVYRFLLEKLEKMGSVPMYAPCQRPQ